MASLAAVMVILRAETVDAAADVAGCRDDSVPPPGSAWPQRVPRTGHEGDHTPGPPVPRLPAQFASRREPRKHRPEAHRPARPRVDPPGTCPSRHEPRAGRCHGVPNSADP